MPLESWKVVFEVGGIVLLALTFVFGAGAWLVNNRLSLLQSRELEDFKLKSQEEQQKTAAAQAEAAKAQLELRRYIDHVDRKAGPRRLDREKLLEQLNGKPIGLAVMGCENLSSGFEVGADPFLKENEVHIIIGQKK